MKSTLFYIMCKRLRLGKIFFSLRFSRSLKRVACIGSAVLFFSFITTFLRLLRHNGIENGLFETFFFRLLLKSREELRTSKLCSFRSVLNKIVSQFFTPYSYTLKSNWKIFRCSLVILSLILISL